MVDTPRNHSGKWLAEQGAGKIFLMSRSGKAETTVLSAMFRVDLEQQSMNDVHANKSRCPQ